MHFDHLAERLQFWIRTRSALRGFKCTLKRIRRESRTRKVKVFFLVSEIAKWKGQSVYDWLAKSEEFEPQIAVMELTRFAGLPEPELRRRASEKLEYFRSRGMAAMDIWKYGTRNCLSAEEIGADIVFYQQPWDLPRAMLPWNVASRALTFYFPYYTPNLFDRGMEVGHKLHHFLYGYIVWDEAMAELCRECEKEEIGAYATTYLPFGHPALDAIPRDVGESPVGCVIYAPHWTVACGDFRPKLRYSTFLEYGQTLLGFAKSHPEIKWVFKPHPELAAALVKSGAMTEAEVSEYYDSWSSIGEICTGGPDEYLRIFENSFAMITDCGSFMTEYGCLGKPLIRLVSPDSNVQPPSFLKPLYSKFYEVRSGVDLQSALDLVVIGRQDPLRDERRGEMLKAGLLSGTSASRIGEFLRDQLR